MTRAIRYIESKLGFVVIGLKPGTTKHIGEIVMYFGQYPLRRGELQIIAKGSREDWEKQNALFSEQIATPLKRGESFFRCRYIPEPPSLFSTRFAGKKAGHVAKRPASSRKPAAKKGKATK